MAITFYVVLFFAGGNDLIATHFHLSINDITNTFQVLLFVVPPIAFWVTKRICLGLQRRDRELVLHGRETGRIVRSPHGEFIEVHEPLDPMVSWRLVQHDAYHPSRSRRTRTTTAYAAREPPRSGSGPRCPGSTSRTGSSPSPRPSWPRRTTTATVTAEVEAGESVSAIDSH